jgi:type III secretory pathway component EscR
MTKSICVRVTSFLDVIFTKAIMPMTMMMIMTITSFCFIKRLLYVVWDGGLLLNFSDSLW